ncbi:MAG TPA: YigZ family protein [Thermoanaerobaculia bacterium]
MIHDHYRTLAAAAEARTKIERSEFLGLAFPVESEDAFFAELARVEKKYFDATHHCWAFRLFADARQRSSDAGEPSGTAGKPILQAIESAELHDAGVIVVRWYGGIKLGTGGLARAYRDAAAEVLRGATTLDRYVYERVTVIVPFDMLSVVYRLVSPPNVVLVAERFADENEFDFDVRASLAAEFRKSLVERRLRFTPP